MPFDSDPRDLVSVPRVSLTGVSVLSGAWQLAASNLPEWLSGQRRSPMISFEPVPEHPGRLVHSVAYTSIGNEAIRSSTIATLHRGVFVSRGQRLHKLFPSKWMVIGASDDDSIVVVRFAKTRATPAGINVLVRRGVSLPNLRGIVAHETKNFGLSPEEFARLTWFQLTVSTHRRRR